MGDPSLAVKSYLRAIMDLPWLSEHHFDDMLTKFHRGQFDFVNPSFAPKPAEVRRMLESTHFRRIAKVLEQEIPQIANKPWKQRTEEEKQIERDMRKQIEAAGPYDGQEVRRIADSLVMYE